MAELCAKSQVIKKNMEKKQFYFKKFFNAFLMERRQSSTSQTTAGNVRREKRQKDKDQS